jgi:hypothetical protein
LKPFFGLFIVYISTFSLCFSQYFAKDSLDKYKKYEAQNTKYRLIDRLRFGGGFSGGIGSVSYLNISPTVFYLVSEKYIVGNTFEFIYYKYANNVITNSLKSGVIYGISPFNRYLVTKDIFLQAEILFQNIQTSKANRSWNAYPLAGMGYSVPINQRASFFALLMYNFNSTNSYSFYGPFILRIGFSL